MTSGRPRAWRAVHCGAAGEKKRAELVAQDVHGNMGTNAIRRKIG